MSPAGRAGQARQTGAACCGITDVRGIHLTGVAWAGGAGSSRCALPEVNGRVPGLVPHRRGLPGLPGVAALAGRFHLPALRARRGLAAWRWPRGVRQVQFADLGDGGHDLRPDADAADRVVHRVLAVRHAEGRHLGAEPAAVAGDRLVPDRVGDAGPAAVGAGAPGPGPAGRDGGGGRDLHRRRRAGAARRPGPGQEGAHRHRGGGQGAEGDRPVPDGAAGGRVLGLAAPVRHRPRPAGRDGDHRRLDGLSRAGRARLCPPAAQPAGGPRPRRGPGDCFPLCTGSPRWPSGGCWAPTRARSTRRTCRATWTSSRSASTAAAPAAAAWSSTACSNSPPATTRFATAT